MAPTAHLADKRKSYELEMCKLRVEWQKLMIEELTKERVSKTATGVRYVSQLKDVVMT